MKVRDIIKLVEKDGWVHIRTTGVTGTTGIHKAGYGDNSQASLR